MARDSGIRQQTHRLDEFERFTAPDTADSGLVELFRRFIRTISTIISELYSNDATIRSFWQPGDVKFSFRRTDSVMPGWVLEGTTQKIADYPALYAVVGGDVSGQPGMFQVPKIAGRYLKTVSQGEYVGTLGSFEPGSSGGTDVSYALCSAWFKT